ncbi:nucleoside-diphosphate sugar epimerase [Paenibacillus sp. RC67]|uniref:nucleoside-diphosphate sugar epimerase n=1 Tax=Paenibacillus sp. RC67 TaxID=3039392 RepID=UPI0024ADCAED|nr:nucleoside-diphosphate sugar epimerase [Paenibacillus sp. RC67]
MQRQLDNIIEHMSISQLEMAKILEAQRHIAVLAGQFIHDIPHEHPSFGDIEMLTDNSLNVTKNIAAYLNSLADLADTLAENLIIVMKGIDSSDEE